MKITKNRLEAFTGRSNRIARLTCVLLQTTALLVVGCDDRTSRPARAHAEEARKAPAVADPADWCVEHGLPESLCTKCNPALVERFRQAGDWCAGHGFPESACPFCNPIQPPVGTPPPSAPAPDTRIRLGSSDIERAAGIETVVAAKAEMANAVECTARIDFNRNRMAEVRSPVPGIVREVSVDFGGEVIEGEALFVLESVMVGDLQARRHAAREGVEAARANLTRLEGLREGAISSPRQVELGRRELETAEAELRSIDQSLRLSGASREDRTGRFEIPSPITGTVVRRPAVVGSYAAPSQSLATIADTSTMWALLDVSEWDASLLRMGQPVEVRVDGVAGPTFPAAVSLIASEVDPRTRTVTVRAEVRNTDNLLRANQFARASIRVAAPEEATVVPEEALQRIDGETVVFVRTEEAVYEPRTVRPGRSDGRRVQLIGDVRVGDPVVTTGAFLLRTELSRESIGAGCCEVTVPGGK